MRFFRTNQTTRSSSAGWSPWAPSFDGEAKIWILGLLYTLLISFAAHAAPDKSTMEKDIKVVEKTIAENTSKNTTIATDLKKTERELSRLENSTKSLAKKVKDTESRAAELRLKLGALEAQEATLIEEIGKLKKLITPMLKAGMDMARRPTDLNLFMDDPARAADVLTAHVALRSAAKAVQEYLDSYAKAQASLKQVEIAVLQEKAKLEAVVDELADNRDQLSAEMDARAKLADTKRAELSATSKTISELKGKRDRLLSLLTAIKQEEETRRAEQKKIQENKKITSSTVRSKTVAPKKRAAPTLARGLPASGYVVQRFGEADPDSGLAARGLTIEGESGGLVTAPTSGEVRFTGPFKGFGQLVIIEHSNGDFSLLGGLGKIAVSEGQKLGKGAPVGSLSASTSGTPRLYYERRRGGSTPVDPMSLF